MGTVWRLGFGFDFRCLTVVCEFRVGFGFDFRCLTVVMGQFLVGFDVNFSLIFCGSLSMVVVGVFLSWICHGGFFFDFYFLLLW